MARKKAAKKAAKRAAARRKPARRSSRPRMVTVRQLTNTLYGIEEYCRAVREILLLMPPDRKFPSAEQRLPPIGPEPTPPLDYGCFRSEPPIPRNR